ncbi:hypothetical protein AMTRI_Chr02g221990 [Amborella trichopoda]
MHKEECLLRPCTWAKIWCNSELKSTFVLRKRELSKPLLSQSLKAAIPMELAASKKHQLIFSVFVFNATGNSYFQTSLLLLYNNRGSATICGSHGFHKINALQCE